jgi:hypothetical protein
VDTATPNPPTTLTPILDRTIPLPQLTKNTDPQRVIGIVLGITVGLVAVLLEFGKSLGPWITKEISNAVFWPRDGGQLFLLVFDLAAGFFLATAIHEVAHILVGVRVGFRFNSLRVGLLQIDWPFRISLYSGQRTMAAGWAAMIPVKTDALAWRTVVMISAGSAANLFSGLTVLFLPFSMGSFSFSFVIVSLFFGFLNLLPLQKGPELTDGKRILMLLRSRECGERLAALVKLSAALKEGVPSENLSADSLARAVAVKDNSPETVHAYALAYGAAYYRHENEKAAEYLETCLKYSPYTVPMMRQALMSDAGIFQARKRKRIDLAEQWLADLPATTEIPWLRAYVEAAIFEAKGDITGALKKLDDIEMQILAVPDQMKRDISHRSLLRWRSELRPPVAAGAAQEQRTSR